MNFLNKEICLIITLIGIIYIGYSFNPYFFGGDSWYYLNFICNQNNFERTGVELFVFSLLPCNVLILKFISFVFFTVTSLIIYFTLKLFSSRLAFIITLLTVCLSPALFYVLLKLENDLFAMPFLALSVYFYFKAGELSFKPRERENYVVNTLLSMLFLTPAFLMFNLTGYVVLVFGSTNVLYTIISVLAILLNPNILNFAPVFGIDELIPLIGLTSLGFLLIGLIKPNRQALLATFFVALQGRHLIFIPLFLSVSTLKFFDNLFKGKEEKIVLLEKVLFVWCLFGALAFAFISVEYGLSNDTINITSDAVKLAQTNNINLYNDWEVGWVVTYFKYDTNYKSSIPDPDYNSLVRPFYALTKSSLDCNSLIKKLDYSLYIC